MLRFIIILHVTSTIMLCLGRKIDNSVLIEDGIGPQIFCLRNGLKFEVTTEKPFTGRLYVKGMYNNSRCNKMFNGTTLLPTLSVAFEDCHHTREKMTRPPGMMFAMEIVAQFHPFFTTTVDRAFVVSCSYREADEVLTNSQQLQGNIMSLPGRDGGKETIPVHRLAFEPRMPQCLYSIHKESPMGPLITSARVGETTFHKWTCQPSIDGEFHGMLVHSCFASSGNTSIPLLDRRGCSLDPYAMATPIYALNLTMAYVEVHAFKFADAAAIAFSCSVALCLRIDGRCKGVTPPNCLAISVQASALSPDGDEANTNIDSILERKFIDYDYEVGVSSGLNDSKKLSRGVVSPPGTGAEPFPPNVGSYTIPAIHGGDKALYGFEAHPRRARQRRFRIPIRFPEEASVESESPLSNALPENVIHVQKKPDEKQPSVVQLSSSFNSKRVDIRDSETEEVEFLHNLHKDNEPLSRESRQVEQNTQQERAIKQHFNQAPESIHKLGRVPSAFPAPPNNTDMEMRQKTFSFVQDYVQFPAKAIAGSRGASAVVQSSRVSAGDRVCVSRVVLSQVLLSVALVLALAASAVCMIYARSRRKAPSPQGIEDELPVMYTWGPRGPAPRLHSARRRGEDRVRLHSDYDNATTSL